VFICRQCILVSCYTEQEVRSDAKILHHGSNSSLYDVMLPAGDKQDSYKLCVTIEGVDAFLAKSPVTIAIRVSLLHRTFSLLVPEYKTYADTTQLFWFLYFRALSWRDVAVRHKNLS